jgi:rhamnose utilization protein RhaD (predicted bifunctional aldolase and dehydrogenase)/NAD(P)-dependent dehydrogenase (short-subunit alcohol dehydrogenase family)
MESRWSDDDAKQVVEAYAQEGVSADLALRTYTARLLGTDPKLVLHGGGNTSVKTRMMDVYGDEIPVLCVKGSGWDLATIEPQGHPAVRLEPLHRLRRLASLSDEAMVNALRSNLLDSSAPNPSVETLLHAFLPHKFVDHTHSVAAIALADQPNAETVCRRAFGGRVTCVPYVMPGFQLAKLAAEVFDADPDVKGLVLLKHGIFSFGSTARESYERMIALVSAAERFIADNQRNPMRPAKLPAAPAPPAKVLPVLRGAFGRVAGSRYQKRWIFDARTGDRAMAFAASADLASYATRGPATPDHVIRIKAKPLIVPTPPAGDLETWAKATDAALAAYAADYESYFERQNARVGGVKRALDSLPRVVIAPGLGLFGVGKSSDEARIAADLAEAAVESILDAEAVGRYQPVGEDDVFDIEYWSLEQAKLGKSTEKRLERQIVAVTGGGGGIGAEIAKAFAAEGAEVALLDIDETAVEAAAAHTGRHALAIGCDVTDPASVERSFERITAHFGGLDILVSNAGAAWTGMMADMPDAVLRRSFELNFFAHQNVARAAVAIMQQQELGGALLFNVSKQALNPGADFGAYGTSKAALLALVRQYALEHGSDGIRANAVNADRIRSGLLTDEMITLRARSRGLSATAYMRGNLLGQEVTAADVAQAFLMLALLPKTTGAVLTVDGGNVAAMVR